MSAFLFADGSDDAAQAHSKDQPSVNAAAERVAAFNSENDGLTPISRQRNDLGSLFSIDDFNPFSVNEDHFNDSGQDVNNTLVTGG